MKLPDYLPSKEWTDDLIRRALREDLAETGDITTSATVPRGRLASAVIAARKPGVIAGLSVAARVFELVDPALQVTLCVEDGAKLAPGDVVLDLEGSAASILIAERVALNFLGHLSGVATATAALVAAVAHTRARICCTRKTTPGLRALEKYAVRCGGGVNHRMGLFDAILIKDNHIAAAGGVAASIRAARKVVAKGIKFEVEVDTLEQLDEALAEGIDQVLLDNMTPAQLKLAVAKVNGRAVTEASGSITAATAGPIAEAGVDLLSVGWITHSAPCLDLGLDFKSGI
ncbi:MAG: carboxylating nicotinate-nucleotide diphosphorylase [Rhodospirillaceae bacterium]|nr:carboxylating nicotinate-nucleotide diphosphorylase [Rhodospirillaceae bacterium]